MTTPPQEWPISTGRSSPIASAGRLYLFSLKDGKDNLICLDAKTGKELWSDGSDTGWADDYEGTRATPTIDGDSIYTYGGRGELVSRDVATGKPRWKMNVLTSNCGLR